MNISRRSVYYHRIGAIIDHGLNHWPETLAIGKKTFQLGLQFASVGMLELKHGELRIRFNGLIQLHNKFSRCFDGFAPTNY